MSENERRPPRELAEAQILELRHASRAKLAGAAGRVRLALLEVEGAILELILQESAINLLERSCPGRPGCAPNTRRIVAGAIEARLGEILRPYLGDAEDRGTCPETAEAELLALAELEEEPA